MPSGDNSAKKQAAKKATRRKPLQQSDVPAFTLEQALRVPRVISDQYAREPATPLDVAMAMDVSPTTGSFKMLTGAAVAYGLTEGAAQAEMISLTPLGRRIVAPTEEGDDEAAKREALLQPRVLREFLTKYDGHSLPKRSIALNVLETMGVPVDATERAYEMITDNGADLGVLVEHKGKTYVRLDALPSTPAPSVDGDSGDGSEDTDSSDEPLEGPPLDDATAHRTLHDAVVDPQDLSRNKRVFITHGKNRQVVDQLKELLHFGQMEPVVSVEKESVAKPVSDKVLDDMRSCGAAIVHVGNELRLLDESGNEHVVLNPNVLIEIGAAMALYERRFILLVEEGVKLPSNLQGLYEVRYTGDRLEYEATMKLLRAFNEFKSPPGGTSH